MLGWRDSSNWGVMHPDKALNFTSTKLGRGRKETCLGKNKCMLAPNYCVITSSMGILFQELKP